MPTRDVEVLYRPRMTSSPPPPPTVQSIGMVKMGCNVRLPTCTRLNGFHREQTVSGEHVQDKKYIELCVTR